MAGRNQHSNERDRAAHEELRLMHTLAKKPASPTDLAAALNLTLNRVRYILRGLRAAECTYRVPGTHIVALAEVGIDSSHA